MFRRLFHQSVAGLLSCSLSLTASSQLKPFVFCIAVCSPVGRRTVIFLLLSLQMPGTHSTGQLLLWLVYRRGLRLLLVHSLTHFFIDGVAVLFCCLILVTTGSFFFSFDTPYSRVVLALLDLVLRHSLLPHRSSLVAALVATVPSLCFSSHIAHLILL